MMSDVDVKEGAKERTSEATATNGSTAIDPMSSRTHLQTRAKLFLPSSGSMAAPNADKTMEYEVESVDRIGDLKA